MKHTVVKPPKIAVCKECNGTGKVKNSDYEWCECGQYCGSGRVIVSARIDWRYDHTGKRNSNKKEHNGKASRS